MNVQNQLQSEQAKEIEKEIYKNKSKYAKCEEDDDGDADDAEDDEDCCELRRFPLTTQNIWRRETLNFQ